MPRGAAGGLRARRGAGVNEPDRPGDNAARTANGVELFVRTTLRQIRRLAVLVCGLTVVLIGVIMFVTPGPGLLVLPVGLGILAIEFVWARRLLAQVRERAVRLRGNGWRREAGGD